jgi:hypothetical protein
MSVKINEGIRKVNAVKAIISKLSATPVKDRPWNQKGELTKAMANFAQDCLDDEEVYGGADFPANEKPAKSGIVNMLNKIHGMSLAAAEQYEISVKGYERHAGAYTIITNAQGDVLEMGDVETLVNMEVSKTTLKATDCSMFLRAPEFSFLTTCAVSLQYAGSALCCALLLSAALCCSLLRSAALCCSLLRSAALFCALLHFAVLLSSDT